MRCGRILGENGGSEIRNNVVKGGITFSGIRKELLFKDVSKV